jgi:hypothetical protein
MDNILKVEYIKQQRWKKSTNFDYIYHKKKILLLFVILLLRQGSWTNLKFVVLKMHIIGMHIMVENWKKKKNSKNRDEIRNNTPNNNQVFCCCFISCTLIDLPFQYLVAISWKWVVLGKITAIYLKNLVFLINYEKD